MDEGLQAAQGVDQGGNQGLAGGTAQPCEVTKGKPGRRKKLRPLTPELARELVVTIRHFLPELAGWFGGIEDPRESGLATYPLKLLLLQGILMFLTHSGSRNHFNNWAGEAVQMARLLSRLAECEAEAVAHLDTLEGVLRKLEPTRLEVVLAAAVRRLIRMKALDGWRVRGRFLLTARPIDRDNVWSVAAAARLRWRCENEGFNVLKNGGFALEHVYSRNPAATEGYCHLMLIAHLIQQLLVRGRLGAVFKTVFKSFKHYGQKLAQSLATSVLPAELPMPGQIRLSSA